MEYVIITGASKGLGKSLSTRIIGTDKILILIARTESKLIELKDELKNKYNQKSVIYSFDLSEYKNVNALIDQIISNINTNSNCKITFLNNAGNIHPIKIVSQLNNEDIKNNFTVNSMTPILIISKLIAFAKEFNNQLKIINISSGASRKPIDSWGLYCSSKAAIRMYLEVAILENMKDSSIKIVSVDPGVMNTGMQESIRNVNSKDFRKKDEFVNLYIENKLRNTDQVAQIIKENFLDNWNVNSVFMNLNQFYESE